MLRLEFDEKEEEVDPIEEKCKDFLLGFAKKLPSRSVGGFLKIEDLRLVVTDQCPYSCLYCGVYIMVWENWTRIC